MVLISSDLPESVYRPRGRLPRGRIAAVLPTRETTQEEIMRHASVRSTQAQPAQPPRTRPRSMTDRNKDLIQKFAALPALGGHRLSLTSEAFSVGNAMTVSLQVTSIVYLGIGATLVILTGGIDLSVGSGAGALSGVAAALSVKAWRAGGAGHAH